MVIPLSALLLWSIYTKTSKEQDIFANNGRIKARALRAVFTCLLTQAHHQPASYRSMPAAPLLP